MRIIVSATGINLEKEAIDALSRIYPEGRRGQYHFGFRLPQEDSRVHAIIKWLAAAGLHPRSVDRQGPLDRSKEYLMRLHREYDPLDLEKSEYFELIPSSQTEGLFRNDRGEIKIDGRELQPSADFASTKLSWIIVPDRVKRLLQQSDLHHIAFRPTVLVGGLLAKDHKEPVPWEVYGEPWWELTSELILPPLSPSVDLRDANGQPLPYGSNNFSNGCHLREGLYSHPELHYPKRDLQAIEPFDAALTYEPFGNKGVPLDWRKLVVSRRFREVCLEHEWNTDWVPVRIDEG